MTFDQSSQVISLRGYLCHLIRYCNYSSLHRESKICSTSCILSDPEVGVRLVLDFSDCCSKVERIYC